MDIESVCGGQNEEVVKKVSMVAENVIETFQL